MNLFLGQNVALIKAIVDWGQPELTRGLIFFSRTTWANEKIDWLLGHK